MPFFWRFEEGDRGNDDGGEGKIEKKRVLGAPENGVRGF